MELRHRLCKCMCRSTTTSTTAALRQSERAHLARAADRACVAAMASCSTRVDAHRDSLDPTSSIGTERRDTKSIAALATRGDLGSQSRVCLGDHFDGVGDRDSPLRTNGAAARGQVATPQRDIVDVLGRTDAESAPSPDHDRTRGRRDEVVDGRTSTRTPSGLSAPSWTSRM